MPIQAFNSNKGQKLAKLLIAKNITMRLAKNIFIDKVCIERLTLVFNRFWLESRKLKVSSYQRWCLFWMVSDSDRNKWSDKSLFSVTKSVCVCESVRNSNRIQCAEKSTWNFALANRLGFQNGKNQKSKCNCWYK